MPYHHTKRHRNSRLLIFVVAALASIGIGATSGALLASQKANQAYTELVSDVNQNFAKQIQKKAQQSQLSPAITRDYVAYEKAKTYAATLSSTEALRRSMDAFSSSALKTCDDTSDHIATLDMTPVTKSKHLPDSTKQGFDALRASTVSGTACQQARELIAYNTFSVFTLSTSSIIKQIEATDFRDKTVLKQLQDQLPKAPTTADIETLKLKYGTSFANYVTSYIELIKSYSGLLTAKTNNEFLLQIERLEASTAKADSFAASAQKDHLAITLKDTRSALANSREAYEATTQINAATHDAKIDTTPFLGALLVNAINLHITEQQAYPSGASLADLVQTLRTKNYLKPTDSFTSLQYTFDNKSNIYKLSIPTGSGTAVFEFFNITPPKTEQLEASPQLLTTQT